MKFRMLAVIILTVCLFLFSCSGNNSDFADNETSTNENESESIINMNISDGDEDKDKDKNENNADEEKDMKTENLMCERDYFPKFSDIETLYVITPESLNDKVRVTIQTLQGILAQKGSKEQIYIEYGNSYETWLSQLKKDYQIKIVYKFDAWKLIEQFKDYITDLGYVKFKLNTPSVNFACTAAGQKGYIAVEGGDTSKAEQIGLELKINAVEDYATDADVFDTFEKNLSNKYLFQQNYKNLALRDIGVAYGAYYFADSKAANKITEHVLPNAPLFGWHTDEVTGVNKMSAKSIVTIASDHASNLTVFSSLPRKIFEQPQPKKNAVNDSQVHYVTFMLSDGDNLQWYLNGALLDRNQYAHKDRGTVPMGWTCPPTIADLAPNILEYGYGTKTDNDSFIAAVSGFGYVYPSQYNIDDLADFADKTAYYMQKCGLDYMQILDDAQLYPKKETLDLFTAYPQIKGIFYMTGDMYRMGKGRIIWSNDKPVVCARESLWSGEGASRKKRNKTMYEMAVRLNTYPKDATVIDGYTAINVHAWSHDYDDILKMREFLDTLPGGDKVVFVTPDEFMELIVNNIPHENAAPKLNFSSGNDKMSYYDYSVIPQS